MTEKLDLAQLRGVAEEATPGPWEAKPYLYGVRDGRIRVTSPSDGNEYNLVETVLPENAAHIATFDPPAVMGLIDRLEAAEAAVQRVRELHKPTRDPFGESCAVCVGDSRRNPYPCDTIRALDGGEQE